jgi:large subunit ribosomal protein L16
MAILGPKKLKYKTRFRGRLKGFSTRGTKLSFGSYGLKALESNWITVKQIEASRKSIMRYLKKGGKLWIRIFPDKPVTSKGTEFPMGGGKGAFSHYVFPIKPGRIIFELEGVKEDIARKALRKANDKLPIKAKFIKK